MLIRKTLLIIACLLIYLVSAVTKTEVTRLYLKSSPAVLVMNSQEEAEEGIRDTPPMLTPQRPYVRETTPARTFMPMFPIQLPPFIRKNVDRWLMQIEAIFRTYEIINEQRQVDIVVGNLPADVIGRLQCAIQNLPTEQPFVHLKAGILAAYPVEKPQLSKLFVNQGSESQKPSEVYEELRNIGQNYMNAEGLRELWFERLSTSVKVALTTLPVETSLANMILTADRVYAVTTGQRDGYYIAKPKPTLYRTQDAQPVQTGPVRSLPDTAIDKSVAEISHNHPIQSLPHPVEISTVKTSVAVSSSPFTAVPNIPVKKQQDSIPPVKVPCVKLNPVLVSTSLVKTTTNVPPSPPIQPEVSEPPVRHEIFHPQIQFPVTQPPPANIHPDPVPARPPVQQQPQLYVIPQRRLLLPLVTPAFQKIASPVILHQKIPHRDSQRHAQQPAPFQNSIRQLTLKSPLITSENVRPSPVSQFFFQRSARPPQQIMQPHVQPNIPLISSSHLMNPTRPPQRRSMYSSLSWYFSLSPRQQNMYMNLGQLPPPKQVGYKFPRLLHPNGRPPSDPNYFRKDPGELLTSRISSPTYLTDRRGRVIKQPARYITMLSRRQPSGSIRQEVDAVRPTHPGRSTSAFRHGVAPSYED